MNVTAPRDVKAVQLFAVIAAILLGFWALFFGLLFDPMLGAYFVPLLVACWRLYAMRRWAACVLIIVAWTLVYVAAQPLVRGHLPKNYDISAGPFYLDGAILYSLSLTAVVAGSWRHLKCGL